MSPFFSAFSALLNQAYLCILGCNPTNGCVTKYTTVHSSVENLCQKLLRAMLAKAFLKGLLLLLQNQILFLKRSSYIH